MSYIRCTSNPEGIYAVATKVGRRMLVEITHCIDPPHASKQSMLLIPEPAFRRVCQIYLRGGQDDVCSGGLRVREVHVFEDDGRRVPERWFRKNCFKSKRRTRFQMQLSYRGRWFRMWRVTWQYIAENAAVQVWRKPRRSR